MFKFNISKSFHEFDERNKLEDISRAFHRLVQESDLEDLRLNVMSILQPALKKSSREPGDPTDRAVNTGKRAPQELF